MTRTAMIAGAGYAGLAAAAVLARAGWRVCVYEADPEPRSVGAGLYVHGFVHDALRKTGAYDDFMRGAFKPAAHCVYIDGARQSNASTDGNITTTTRAALHVALIEAARRAGVSIAGGSRAVAADPRGALILADGTRLAADLVIAADGVRSTITQTLDIPITRVPHQDGITRILLDRDGLRDDKWNSIHDYYDYRGRPLRVLYTPCGSDAFYFCLMAPIIDVEATSVPIAGALWTARFPDLAPTLRRVGSAGRHDRYATTTLSTWSRGRAAIVGDAAHAMPSSLGQGAGVSIVNAVALAEAVAHADDIDAGLGDWEVAMRPMVEGWQRRVEDVASQRSLSRAVRPSEQRLVELSSEDSDRKHARQEGDQRMTLVPSASWYTEIIAAVDQQQAGIKDHLGRPWAQHFERVALRLIFRKPDASRAHIESALLHDAMMERGGGREMLNSLGISQEACEIIEITTPPPNADYYRRFQEVGPAECEIYLDYVRKLCASGNRAAIQMKLADITDTIEACRTGRTPLLIDQFVNRYEPSRKLLEQALGSELG